MRDDRERLLDIQEAIARIEKYAAQGRESFERDELIQTWMLRHLQIIGEAARAMSEDFRTQHPELAWADMIGMRNILVHIYFGIDLDLVWQAVTQSVPHLKQQVETILQSLSGTTDDESTRLEQP